MRVLQGIVVLLVEDDDDVREMLTTALELRGARVSGAADAAGARAALERDGPDVLVCDIGMPGEDGHALMRALKRGLTRRGIPAVALTARAEREARIASREAGFHYHLTKPVDVEKLVSVLSGLARPAQR
ncbi:MAG TPA: response regulator [Vicinamibacteria bacterium]